jgi:hypothetical protein
MPHDPNVAGSNRGLATTGPDSFQRWVWWRPKHLVSRFFSCRADYFYERCVGSLRDMPERLFAYSN